MADPDTFPLQTRRTTREGRKKTNKKESNEKITTDNHE
jgi:hypothetical protein